MVESGVLDFVQHHHSHSSFALFSSSSHCFRNSITALSTPFAMSLSMNPPTILPFPARYLFSLSECHVISSFDNWSRSFFNFSLFARLGSRCNSRVRSVYGIIVEEDLKAKERENPESEKRNVLAYMRSSRVLARGVHRVESEERSVRVAL
ncbi:hypothetical protein BCR34DRAFT_570614 [Clohesyomyces aquaticus]|uniref:Uncharacterized protein n=1 Tax=Clohesyomyces aquaticus TaxID=1231657 RepID=A0A1Y1ZBB4_9PLEO|nr:hypothetical protein BCR34DRAFT_570614 [Clohesyomyces aquaticus]